MKSDRFEFFGPFGTFLLTFSLPLVVLVLSILVDYGWHQPRQLWDLLVLELKDLRAIHFGAFLGWMGLQTLLYLLVPGSIVKGTLLRNGDRLDYKINAFSCLVLVHIGLVVAVANQIVYPLAWIADNFFQLAVVSCIYSSVQAILLYAFSFRKPEPLLSLSGDSGYFFYDFWMGRELYVKRCHSKVGLKVHHLHIIKIVVVEIQEFSVLI